MAEFGQIQEAYIDGYGDVRFERITVQKPNGDAVEVKDGLIEDLNPFGVTATSIAADVRFKKLTIPGLEAGDRLTYKIIHHQKPLAPGRAFGGLKLSALAGDPVQTYELDLPSDSGIRVRLREGIGASWEELPTTAERRIRRLSLRVPRADQRTPTKAALQAEAEPDVIFTSFLSWDEVARWWWALSQERLNSDPTLNAEAATLTSSKTTPREKVEALHVFVASRIRYLNVSFGIGRMQPQQAAKVLANRYGDCKDKHALLAALASAVGIDVRPVLIDSTHPDLHDDVPAPQQFDHMISVARLGPEPAEWLWLDATNSFAPPGYLGPTLRDKRALLIEASGEGRIVRTPAELPFIPRTEVKVKGTLAPDAVLRARVVWRVRSDLEVSLRSIFATMPQHSWAEVIQVSLGRDWKDGKVTNIVASDSFDVVEPFRIEFDVERPAPAPGGKQRLWIPLPAFLRLPPASASVEVAAHELSARVEIEIPEDMGVHAPRSVSLDRPFGRFESIYSVEGRLLTQSKTLRLVRRSVSDREVASYEAFRKAIDGDHDQAFVLRELASSSVQAVSASPLKTESRPVLLPKDAAGKSVELQYEVDDGFMDAELANIPEDVSLCMCIGVPKSCHPFCGPGPSIRGSINVSKADATYKPGTYGVSVYYYPWDTPRTRDVEGTLTLTYAPSAPAPASAFAGMPPEEVAKKVRDALEPLRGSHSYSSADPGVRSVVAMGRVAIPELLVIVRENDARRWDPCVQGATDALPELVADEDLPALAALLADGHVEVAGALAKLSEPAVREALLVPLRKGFAGHDLTISLLRFQGDPEVQDAVVAYLEKFGPAADYRAGYVAEFAGNAGIRAAVPVLTRLVATGPAGAQARRLFASALVTLHDPAGIGALVNLFLAPKGNGWSTAWERHETGEVLNRVVGERFYVGSFAGAGEAHGNFEDAAERFRAWWSDAQARIHWDDKLHKWTW